MYWYKTNTSSKILILKKSELFDHHHLAIEVFQMENLGKGTFDVFQFFFMVDVGVTRGDIMHIRNQYQPALFRFAIIERVFRIFLFNHLQDFFRMQLVKQ